MDCPAEKPGTISWQTRCSGKQRSAQYQAALIMSHMSYKSYSSYAAIYPVARARLRPWLLRGRYTNLCKKYFLNG